RYNRPPFSRAGGGAVRSLSGLCQELRPIGYFDPFTADVPAHARHRPLPGLFLPALSCNPAPDVAPPAARSSAADGPFRAGARVRRCRTEELLPGLPARPSVERVPVDVELVAERGNVSLRLDPGEMLECCRHPRVARPRGRERLLLVAQRAAQDARERGGHLEAGQLVAREGETSSQVLGGLLDRECDEARDVLHCDLLQLATRRPGQCEAALAELSEEVLRRERL